LHQCPWYNTDGTLPNTPHLSIRGPTWLNYKGKLRALVPRCRYRVISNPSQSTAKLAQHMRRSRGWVSEPLQRPSPVGRISRQTFQLILDIGDFPNADVLASFEVRSPMSHSCCQEVLSCPGNRCVRTGYHNFSMRIICGLASTWPSRSMAASALRIAASVV